ncbi:hypothetical protein FHR92_005164 [Fontibacillus solani]|uniref:Copper amine oxidase-like N-terminal domain-containing protein n=1 Tax=Fontibacillus solani TaxID=1572857 RepID=A0A7W3SYL8_9BACL|nr:hypothetical protein [Fontibacillus solani]MBA9088646.1 hypothetical protein [Fontibacillus solani]
MKKYIAGFVAGIIFMVSASAFADTISLVGKKVTGEYSIVIDNKNIPEKGAIIDSKANVPVRALSEALGAGVKVEGKTIYITSDVGGQVEEVIIPKTEIDIKETPKTTRPIKAIQYDIDYVKDRIEIDNMGIRIIESNSDSSNKEKIELLKKTISDNEEKLKVLQEELAEAQK